MTSKYYYWRNWTPGPPPKQIIDHTHQPIDYNLKLWAEMKASTKQIGDQYYFIDSRGKQYQIDYQWYCLIRQIDRDDYNMYHRWFRNEIHFADEDKRWTFFKMPDQRNVDDYRLKMIKPYLTNLTAKQRQLYEDLAVGYKQVEIADKNGVTEGAICNAKRKLIKKLRKELLNHGGIY